MTFAFRRPKPARASNIGAWLTVLQAQAWFAVLCNCVLIFFTSEQMLGWFPSLFAHVTVGNGLQEQTLVQGRGRYAVALMFGFEHALLLVGLAIQFGVRDVPKWVATTVARREYHKHQRLVVTQRAARLNLLRSQSHEDDTKKHK